MKLRFMPRAAQDLADIGAYLRERNPKAALRVRNFTAAHDCGWDHFFVQ